MAKVKSPNAPLADVNVLDVNDPNNSNLKKGDDHKIVVCFMPDPDTLVGEGGSRAVLALDASKSMKPMFGGESVFETAPNYVQMVSRKLGEILCGVTKSGKVDMLYWALNPGGPDIEEMGAFDVSECAAADISGPKQNKMGTGTQMLPAIKHIVEGVFEKTDWAMGVIITDGIIEDEEACTKYCMALGQRLKDEGKTEKLKLVLIGVGQEVDEGQLERFDDMFEGGDLEDDVDIWSSGKAADMKAESDIVGVLFGELMSEDVDVAASGSVLDGSGNEIKSFADGLPGKFNFVLPAGNTSFTVHTPNGEVTQDISEVF